MHAAFMPCIIRRLSAPTGIGRALASEFLEAGDSVCISSRSADRVRETLSALSELAASHGGTIKGTTADVAKPSDVAKLAQFAQSNLGSIDIWINNAGSNGYKCGPTHCCTRRDSGKHLILRRLRRIAA